MKKQPRFRPRNFTAVGLCATWLMISLFFIGEGTFPVMWSIFAGVALLLGAAALWVLFNDRPDGLP